jgi:DNA-binding response OmpR family regulator
MNPLSILLVDDDPDLAEGLEIVLQLEDMRVERAASGEQGLAKFRRGGIDVSLVDVKLPGMSGTECLREFRAIEPDAKVLMMTAYVAQDSREAALEAGALDLLHKPLNIEEVMDMLKTIQRQDAARGDA